MQPPIEQGDISVTFFCQLARVTNYYLQHVWNPFLRKQPFSPCKHILLARDMNPIRKKKLMYPTQQISPFL